MNNNAVVKSTSLLLLACFATLAESGNIPNGKGPLLICTPEDDCLMDAVRPFLGRHNDPVDQDREYCPQVTAVRDTFE